jgi:putative intracellular protease/amidase
VLELVRVRRGGQAAGRHLPRPAGAARQGPLGRSATCYRKVADELRAAGVRYRDEEVVVDGNLVTSRQPSDLSAFLREALKLLRARGA